MYTLLIIRYNFFTKTFTHIRDIAKVSAKGINSILQEQGIPFPELPVTVNFPIVATHNKGYELTIVTIALYIVNQS